MKEMTQKNKVILVVVIAVIALVAGYALYMNTSKSATTASSGNPATDEILKQMNSGTFSPPTASGGSSDADLAKQAASVDSQMNGLSSDTSSVDASLNDQSVAQ